METIKCNNCGCPEEPKYIRETQLFECPACPKKYRDPKWSRAIEDQALIDQTLQTAGNEPRVIHTGSGSVNVTNVTDAKRRTWGERAVEIIRAIVYILMFLRYAVPLLPGVIAWFRTHNWLIVALVSIASAVLVLAAMLLWRKRFFGLSAAVGQGTKPARDFVRRHWKIAAPIGVVMLVAALAWAAGWLRTPDALDFYPAAANYVTVRFEPSIRTQRGTQTICAYFDIRSDAPRLGQQLIRYELVPQFPASTSSRGISGEVVIDLTSRRSRNAAHEIFTHRFMPIGSYHFRLYINGRPLEMDLPGGTLRQVVISGIH